MNDTWGQFVIDSFNVQIPIHYDQQGELQYTIIEGKSTELKWKIELTNVHIGHTYGLFLDFVSLRSGYANDRYEHCRLHAEVSSENTQKRVYSTNMNFWWRVLKEKPDVFKRKYPEGSMITAIFKVFSKEDNDSLHLNSQIKMYDDGKNKGDVTLNIHVVKKGRDEHIGPKPAKRRKAMPLNGANGNTLIKGEPIQMRTYSSVLRSRSPYFASMLDNDMKEAREMVVDIYADNVDDVEAMVFYLFTNRLRAGWRYTATKLIRLAHLYQLKGLFDLCVVEIVENLDVDNYVESAKVFERYEIPKIGELIEIGRDMVEELKQKDSYQELSYLFRKAVLEKDSHPST